MRRNGTWLGGVVGCLVLAALAMGPASASITEWFSEPDFEWYHPSGSATPNHIWETGDYWAQQFTGTGLGSATSLTLDLYVDDNGLYSGEQVDLDVLLNGTAVGNLTIASGVSGLQSWGFSSFGSIAGPDYYVKLLETNTVPSGYGAASMAADGQSSSATLGGPGAVPELPPFALAALGLLPLGLKLRRRK